MSSFLLNAPSIKKSFAPLFKNINSSSVLQSLECILVGSTDEGITFTTTDLENCIILKTSDKQADGSLNLLIHGKSLRHVLNNSLDDTVSIKTDRHSAKATISTGGLSLGFELQNVDNFPKLPSMDEGKSITIDCKEIYSQFATALKFVSNDDLRPSMNGVYFTDWEGYLHLVSTDAHRMVYHSIMKTPHHMKGVGVIIRKKTVAIFLSAFKKGQVTISVNDTYISFSSDTYHLLSRRIDARYPDFQQVIPVTKLDFFMLRKQLSAFLKIASPFVNKSTTQINLIVNANSISITGGEFGNDINYRLPIYNASDTFEPFKFAISLKFLADAISISADEYCKFSHTMSMTQGVIIDDKCLVMPLMVSDVD